MTVGIGQRGLARSKLMMARKAAAGRLHEHNRNNSSVSLRSLFANDEQRFAKFSARLGDMILDYSKCRVTEETMTLLDALMEAADVPARRAAMFAGDKVNATEGRPALHVALRNRSGRAIQVDGRNVMDDVLQVLDRMEAFADGIRSGMIAGSGGNQITDVVNLGIGGSDLGPAMTTAALAPYHDGPRVHYVSNIDGAHIADTLKGLDAATTLFVIASKSFTTIETMTNAHTARAWIVERLGEGTVNAHFCALSTALDKVAAFGIDKERVFGFWDWVGGRYSVWSAIGLPVMMAIGAEKFREFLSGAHEMDENFRLAPPRENLAMLLGSIGYWHRAIAGYPTRAVLPYDQRLAKFPAHLQQLDMESNGKSVSPDGAALGGPSGPVVFGATGTDGQHAFFQLLHQGTDVVPSEFLIAGEGHEPGLAHHHRMLIANCLAQSEAMAFGKTDAEARAELAAQGLDEAAIERLAPHKVFPGNRPSITIAYRRLDPATLGRLIALYEHRVFVESVLYDVNAFDQWGVELGKTLAGHIDAALKSPAGAVGMNASTRGLMAHLTGR
ncbi:MAG: hypothetical protein RLZ98_491 [Pseudomonadota bacterium]|jgi:glucose-6-phosphate isomerase